MTRCLLLIVFTSLVVLSCNNQSAKEKLIGTWKLTDIANAGDSVIGTATFTKENKLVLKTMVNGKTSDERNCTYELSADNKLLTTKIDTSTIKFEITKLTKDSLELTRVGRINNVARYIRYNN